MNLASIIEPHEPDALALVDGDEHITYGELRERVAALRSALAKHGIGPESRVALVAGNEPAFVIGVLATLGLGGLVAPVLATSPLPELRRKLAVVAPSLVMTGEAGAWLNDEADGTDLPLLDITSVEPSGDAPPIVDRDDDAIAMLMLTSGVSSDAKVAMLSHGNLAWVQNVLTQGKDARLNSSDLVLGVLPFVHIYGLNVALMPTLRIGATVVLQRRFSAARSLDLIGEHQITIVPGAPPMWQQWAEVDAPDDALASVSYAGSGAAALPAEVFAAIKDRFGVEIAEGYGLTETSPAITSSRGVAIRPTSVGRPITGVEVVLVEPDGTPVDIGDSGEIVIRGPGIFKGYLNAPEVTEAVLTEDGWFWTGDMGVFDDDGYLYIVDRIKDVIIVSGFNVYPAEVESVLMEHPDVRGAVVVGSAHGETGEAVVAHVSGDVTADDLDDFVRARLSHYKCPTEYHLVDELPVAATGKPIRRELR
ncbi:MAG: class I adenylate-forming enzyme family protein [Acidimicrobiales bacterium]